MRAGLKRLAVSALGAVCLVGLSACYEDPGATLFEPGVYKGARDPLLEKQRSPEQQQRLEQRFRLVQTDR